MEKTQKVHQEETPSEVTIVEDPSSHKKKRRRPILIDIIFIIILILIGSSIPFYYTRDVSPSPTPTSAPQPTDLPTLKPTLAINCAKVTVPFTQKGTKILQSDGTQYIPYGVTVPGLAHSDYQYWVVGDNAQIEAAAKSWCSNTVRLQVSQDTLVGSSGNSYNSAFMGVIESEVSYAESYGLVVVINAQTEDVGFEPGPTVATKAFWKQIIKVYGNDPQVVLDLFNEPRFNISGETATWQLWQHGGIHNGKTFLGMQDLVDNIRTEGGHNLLWIEGPHTSNTLSQVSSYPITGKPLMYEMHHPVGSHTPSSWDTDFGYLVTKNIAPVVVGEWSNYAAVKGECWPDAPTAAPKFLSYLQSKNIGMTVWTLKKGVMVRSNDLSDPTTMDSKWACQDGLNEGAGSLVQSWYRKNNGK
jgi:hypothetical protein